MDEAILIEIAARFRQLEKVVKFIEGHAQQQKRNMSQAFKDRVDDQLDDVHKAFDACRSDMERLCDEVRKVRQ